MGKILALDYGTKRIGVAVSDEGKKLAFARDYVLTKEKGKLLGVIAAEEIDEIIVGLPKNLAGSETKSTEQARDFVKWLEEKSGRTVMLVDERFSTKEAEAELKAMGTKQKASRDIVDSLVAQRMLTRYLKTNKH